MVVRLDAYSLIYGVLVAVLLPCSRRICYVLWPLYIIVLAVLLGIQYLACLGVPAALCWGMFKCFWATAEYWNAGVNYARFWHIINKIKFSRCLQNIRGQIIHMYHWTCKYICIYPVTKIHQIPPNWSVSSYNGSLITQAGQWCSDSLGIHCMVLLKAKHFQCCSSCDNWLSVKSDRVPCEQFQFQKYQL